MVTPIIMPMNTVFFRNWNKQIRKGLLEIAILNDIRNRRMYAYEIERKFRKSQGLLLSQGAIYNILKRFKRQRLVVTTETKSPDGPGRKYYQLTKTGHKTLVQMNACWQAIKKQLDSIEKGKKLHSKTALLKKDNIPKNNIQKYKLKK